LRLHNDTQDILNIRTVVHGPAQVDNRQFHSNWH